uniref:Lethal(3)malignant brain tumor-like protein 1 n=1 Tax=Magallana gigas TaxID=29159 RepID=K1R8F5_MAGGI
MVSKILPQQNYQVKPINVAKSLIPNQQIHISHIHNVGGKPLPMVVQSANLAQPQTPVTTMTALKRFPVPVSSINPNNNIATSLPTKIRIQGSVATDTTNLAKLDNKDGKSTTGAKLLPAQTPTTNMGTPQHNGLPVKPAAVMTTVSPTSVASAIPVVQKGSHFHVQPGAVAQVGALQGTARLAQVFPSNALSKVGVMTVPNMVPGSYARVPIQMNASASAPLLMRGPGPNVGKMTVSSPSETTPETATSTPGAEQDGHGVETKKVDKFERRDEVEKGESKKSDKAGREDFDPVGAMDWKDGVGELEGSNLKFKMNEFGAIEVITDNLECNETLDSSSEMDVSETNEKEYEPAPGCSGDTEAKSGGRKKEEKLPEGGGEVRDEVCQCMNCGEFGFASEFCKSGRFCSQACATTFTTKKMRGGRGGHNHFMSKMWKKKKKLMAMKGALDEDGPFPVHKNGFKLGMKLEGVDPKHQSLFCVLTVAEICGFRIRLHFDGYSECYDFWSNADSAFLFPVGWCEENNRNLQPPKGFTAEGFNWQNYLKLSKAIAAPRSLFNNLPKEPATPHLFQLGMKLESVDKKNSNLICASTVNDVMSNKILIHFDGWEDTYDYWCDITSMNIHPVGWCEKNGKSLSPPGEYENVHFDWKEYLERNNAEAVSEKAFKPQSPVGFEPGMKIEAVDKRNPILIRVATVMEVDGHLLKLHFDEWDECYDYWVEDDCPDIHPPGWCHKTGHPLTAPPTPTDLLRGSTGCPIPGCKGIGHIKGAKYTGHHSAFGCPYSPLNMNRESTLQDRLGSTRAEEVIQTPTPSSPVDIKMIKGEPPDSPEAVKKCPTPGCDGQGHVTGKFSAHHKLSGCPKAQNNQLQQSVAAENIVPKKSTRGRKPRSYYLNMGDRGPPPKTPKLKIKHEREYDVTSPQDNLQNGIHNSVFKSAMATTPNPEVSLCWERHVKLLPGIHRLKGSEVAKWNIEQVAAFVKTLPGCEEHYKTFKEEQIDGEAFLLISQADLVKILNIKLGPAIKIYNSLAVFKSSLDV